MQVRQVMSRDVVTCGPHDHAVHAAQLMWDHDCGALPIVDEQEHVVGMLTDRDVCMGAYTTGAPLGELPVTRCMAREVVCCRADDELEVALREMAEARVRRLPVVDEERRIVGVLSLSDVLRQVPEVSDAKARRAISEATLATLACICQEPERTVELTPRKAPAETPIEATKKTASATATRATGRTPARKPAHR